MRLVCILNVPGSILCQVAGFVTEVYANFFSACPTECLDTSFHIHYSQLYALSD
jgi:hypothetical protein